MECVKLVDVKKLELSEIEMPKCEEGKVVIKVDSAGICGSDIHNYDNGSPVGLVLGHEFSGTVVETGSDKYKIGDRVTALPISPCMECDACKTGNYQYCSHTWENAVGLSLNNPGGYAEYTSVRCDMVKKLPDNVNFEEACMVEPSSVSLHAINLADVKVGDKVLIVGGGIIGLMAAEFAKKDGASYVALLETNEQRGKKALSYGFVDEYYNALDENVIAKLKERTNGGFTKVIECCGNTPAVTEAISACKEGGKIILVGVSYQPVTIPTVVAVMGEMTLQGSIAYTEQEFERVIELINDNQIDVLKYIDDRVPLNDAQKSFERLTSGKDDAIKIIFKPSEEII